MYRYGKCWWAQCVHTLIYKKSESNNGSPLLLKHPFKYVEKKNCWHKERKKKTIKFIIHRRLHAASNVNNIFNNSEQIEESGLTVCLNLFNNIILDRNQETKYDFFVVAMKIDTEDNLRIDNIHPAHTMPLFFE